MRVTKEKVENGEAYLNVEMEPAEVEASLQKAYSRLVKKVRVPGFRKGKAPREVLERHLGHEGLLDEALNSLVPEAYTEAVKEQGLEPVAQPHLEVVQTDPVIFKAVVPLRPEVKLGDYQQVRLEPPAVEFSEDNVDAVIEQLRRQQATWEPVERPVALEDLVVIDVDSQVDGESLISRKGVQYPVVADAAFPAPGFAQQLVEMKAGEEKEFRLTLPEDYGRPEMAGKEAVFKVSINEIKQSKLPELNDEFAKGVDPELKDLVGLQEKIATELKTSAISSANFGSAFWYSSIAGEFPLLNSFANRSASISSNC